MSEPSCLVRRVDRLDAPVHFEFNYAIARRGWVVDGDAWCRLGLTRDAFAAALDRGFSEADRVVREVSSVGLDQFTALQELERSLASNQGASYERLPYVATEAFGSRAIEEAARTATHFLDLESAIGRTFATPPGSVTDFESLRGSASFESIIEDGVRQLTLAATQFAAFERPASDLTSTFLEDVATANLARDGRLDVLSLTAQDGLPILSEPARLIEAAAREVQDRVHLGTVDGMLALSQVHDDQGLGGYRLADVFGDTFAHLSELGIPASLRSVVADETRLGRLVAELGLSAGFQSVLSNIEADQIAQAIAERWQSAGAAGRLDAWIDDDDDDEESTSAPAIELNTTTRTTDGASEIVSQLQQLNAVNAAILDRFDTLLDRVPSAREQELNRRRNKRLTIGLAVASLVVAVTGVVVGPVWTPIQAGRASIDSQGGESNRSTGGGSSPHLLMSAHDDTPNADELGRTAARARAGDSDSR